MTDSDSPDFQTSQTADKNSGRFLTLDVLRGIAAAAVFLFHCVIRNPGWQDNPLRFGAAGVDLFFMISGFVIFHSLSRNNALRPFLLKRFLRLYPAYWAALTFTAAIILFQSRGALPQNFVATYLSNLTMIQHMLGFANIDDQYWTLEVELMFYAFVALLVWLNQLKNIVVIAFSFLIPYSLLWTTGLIPAGAIRQLEHFAHLPLFLTGIVMYRIIRNGVGAAGILNLILAIGAAILLFNTGGRSRYYMNQYEYAFILTLLTVVFYLAVSGRLAFLNIKPLLFLGKISYSFYLIHQYFTVRFLMPILGKSGLPTLYAIALSFLICTAGAWILYRFLEEPISRLVKGRF